MAITAAQLQTALGTNLNNAQVQQVGPVTGTTLQVWYVVGNQDARGRSRWVSTTASDNAATQAAAVLTALRAT
jgi:hypothetical protein